MVIFLYLNKLVFLKLKVASTNKNYKLLKKFVITSLISTTIGVGLNYLPISKSCLIFIMNEFLTGDVILS